MKNILITMICGVGSNVKTLVLLDLSQLKVASKGSMFYLKTKRKLLIKYCTRVKKVTSSGFKQNYQVKEESIRKH